MGVKNETGSVFGQLTVVRQFFSQNEKAAWFCLCSCGKTHVTTGDALRTGKTKSCGCYRRSGDFVRQHGHASYAKGISRTYKSWCEMRGRCTSPKHISYPNYGARGITYDPLWNLFERFLQDMGDRPLGTSLDRKNNNLGYCKANCQWSDRQVQNNNRRNVKMITHNGKTQSLAQWCKELDLPYQRTYYRLVVKQEPFFRAIAPKRKPGIQPRPSGV